jgi:hypothetical protein
LRFAPESRLAWKQGERVTVWSRRGADFTGRFSRIADAVRGLSADEAMIDGEALVFLDDGQSDFHALLTKHGWEQAALVAFDLLRLGGDDLQQRPLEKRREALMRLDAKRGGDGNRLQRGARRRGCSRVRRGCDAWTGGHRIEASGQLLSERAEPQLAEDQESGFCQDVTDARAGASDVILRLAKASEGA